MSLRLRLLNKALRWGIKTRLAKLTDPTVARAELAFLAPRTLPMPPLSLVRKVALTPGRDALWISNRPGSHPPAPGKVILYLHGGGFIAGSPRTHTAMLARLSRLARVEVCAPWWRLAPEHPFPAGLDDATSAFHALMDRGYAAKDIILGGDSAGGNLVLSLLASLTQQGHTPCATFALSPFTDFRFSGASFQENAKSDVLLPAARAAEIADWYLAGHDPDDPRAAPLNARYDAPPPVYLQYSDSEILRDDSRRMAAHLRAAGGTVHEDEWHDCPHVWALFDGIIPEAREALVRVAGFVRDQFGIDSAKR